MPCCAAQLTTAANIFTNLEACQRPLHRAGTPLLANALPEKRVLRCLIRRSHWGAFGTRGCRELPRAATSALPLTARRNLQVEGCRVSVPPPVRASRWLCAGHKAKRPAPKCDAAHCRACAGWRRVRSLSTVSVSPYVIKVSIINRSSLCSASSVSVATAQNRARRPVLASPRAIRAHSGRVATVA